MAPVISVENLSKKYIIGHKQERHDTLRDALANGMKRFARKLSHPFSASQDDPAHEEFWALRDVSFDIRQGERVGIIGRNGAGKSTLLKILSRITEPTSGKASIRGRVASLLEVGTGFHPQLTGRENIFLNGAILGMSKAEISKKFDEIVAFAEIEKFLDTPVKRYSSGMYVRLAFAVAAHLEPEILIVDEVLAVGDAQFQQKCLGKMEEVGKEGRTVLFVSHNMAVINRLCPRCVYLERGRVANIGATPDVIEGYLTAGFSANQTGEIIFTGGEDKDVHFISARTVGMDGIPRTCFRSDEDIHVILTYQVKRQMSGVNISLVVRTAEQTPLWGMIDWEAYPELLQKRAPGIWTCEFIIPAHILKPDRYYISCGAASPPTHFHIPDPFVIEITSEGTQRLSYKQFGVRGGPIALKMQVKTDASAGLMPK
jgi:homopolymeric O-antigen transport system ATP-binding protein